MPPDYVSSYKHIYLVLFAEKQYTFYLANLPAYLTQISTNDQLLHN